MTPRATYCTSEVSVEPVQNSNTPRVTSITKIVNTCNAEQLLGSPVSPLSDDHDHQSQWKVLNSTSLDDIEGLFKDGSEPLNTCDEKHRSTFKVPPDIPRFSLPQTVSEVTVAARKHTPIDHCGDILASMTTSDHFTFVGYVIDNVFKDFE